MLLFINLIVFLFTLVGVSARTIQVTVGPNRQFQFAPATIFAAVGDVVQFTFLTRNHSVTSTSFDTPCIFPLANRQINSGFRPVADEANGPFPTFSFTVRNTNSIWIACMQAGGAHCRANMNLAINPTNERTDQEYFANARAS